MWAVRLFPTRTRSADACGRGRVTVNDTVAKAATRVSVGDEVAVRLRHGERRVRVVEAIDKRVGAPIAVNCYDDLSERDEPEPRLQPEAEAEPGTREPGSGRPTKRDRRRLDALKGRTKPL